MSGSKKYAAALTMALAVPMLLGSTGPAAARVALKDAAPLRGAAGEVTFDCLLQPFNSAFRYEGTVALTLDGKDDQPGVMTASLPKLPGIAPLPIEDGAMKVVLKGTVDDEPFELRGSTPVNAAPNAVVAVPDVTGTTAGTSDSFGEATEVTITGFRLAMDELMGVTITSDCEVSSGADLGTLTAGGSVQETSVEDPSGEVSATPDPVAAQDDSWTTLPLALWGVPALLVVGGLAFWLGGRSRRRV